MDDNIYYTLINNLKPRFWLWKYLIVIAGIIGAMFMPGGFEYGESF